MKKPNDHSIILPASYTYAWVSDEARIAWHQRLEAANKAIILSTLSGLEHGNWERRSFRLYGNAWLFFLSEIGKTNFQYTSTIDRSASSGTRLCRTVEVYRQQGEVGLLGSSIESIDMQPSIWEAAVSSEQGRLLKENCFEFDSMLMKVLLWQDMGLSFFSDCLASLIDTQLEQLIESHLVWMNEVGLDQESDDIRTILTWPVSWSSLHGIQEIRTPLFKIAKNDPSYHPEKVTVHFLGKDLPKEMPEGLEFPYERSKSRKITGSKSFKKGMEQILE